MHVAMDHGCSHTAAAYIIRRETGQILCWIIQHFGFACHPTSLVYHLIHLISRQLPYVNTAFDYTTDHGFDHSILRDDVLDLRRAISLLMFEVTFCT